MNRRKFSRKLLMAAGGLPLIRFAPVTTLYSDNKPIKPKALVHGDTVGLVAPASSIPDERYEKAVSQIESLGLKVRPGQFVREERGYLAGTDDRRIADIHRMYRDPDIAAIWCVRGGYGASRLLPHLDYSLIAKNPKLLIGYSDITSLHLAIYLHAGVVGFHGPVGASDFTAFTVSHLETLLFEGMANGPITGPPPRDEDVKIPEQFAPFVIRGGTAGGRLIGGNLTLMAALAGTPYLPSFRNKLVFMEDVGEKPYRIDRMLTQLIQATDLSQASGILLGIFEDCQPGEDDRSLTLRETLVDRIGSLGIPAAYGFPFGHIKNQCTLPVGVQAEADMKSLQIRLMEKALS